MKKTDYEWQQLFHYLDDLRSMTADIKKELSELNMKTTLFSEEIRNASYRDGVESAFATVKDAVIDDYLSR